MNCETKILFDWASAVILFANGPQGLLFLLIKTRLNRYNCFHISNALSGVHHSSLLRSSRSRDVWMPSDCSKFWSISRRKKKTNVGLFRDMVQWWGFIISNINSSLCNLCGFYFPRSKSSFDGSTLSGDKNESKAESKTDPKTERKKSSSSSQVMRTAVCVGSEGE